jgi:alpha-beta hydrolase superfamily lysophospholipase
VRVHVDRFNDYLAAVERVHRQLRADFPDLPVFLVGHSLGGLIASLHLLEHQAAYTGCVLSGPAIATDIEPGWLQTLIIKTLSRIYPTAGVLQLDANGVSRDPAEVRRYLDDPLVHNGKMTARMVSELFTAMGEIRASAGSITLPLLLLHGGEDAMTSPKGSRLLYHAVSSEDRELKIYPGLYHEIFNEPEHAAVFADLLSWCEARLPSVVAPVVSTPADVAPAADEDSGEQLS